MTADEDLKRRAAQIKDLLLSSRLKEALEQIQMQMTGVSDWAATSRFEDIDRSYHYMLQYFGQGSPDEHRTDLYHQLIRRAILLNDQVLQARMQPESMLLYYQHLRSDSGVQAIQHRYWNLLILRLLSRMIRPLW